MPEENGEIELRIHPPFLAEERAEIAAFLSERGLFLEGELDYCVVLLRKGRMLGTGSLVGRVIKYLAIDQASRGEGLSARIVSELEAEASRRGVGRLFVFTGPENRDIFESLGYKVIGEALGSALFLEKGGGLDAWCAGLNKLAAEAGRAYGAGGPVGSIAGAADPRAALVMNCNPFTLGHYHLAREAANNSELVFLFVVAEEASSFPFAVRLALIREGVASLPNVVVVPGSEYIISRATFPTYFLKDKAGEAAAVHARLDLDIFARRIAPAVGARRRFVGEEPYSEVTALYNSLMKEMLPERGMEVVEIPRLALGGGAVSASTVRRLIKEGRLSETRKLVPPSTWEYLSSPAALPVLERVAAAEGRH